MKILITGGAGFIGSHLVDELLIKNQEIVVYDVLDPQVHSNVSEPPEYLANDIEFIKNDIRNRDALIKALEDVEVVYHLAAVVGVGQSMYDIHRYVDANVSGTAQLLDILVNNENSVKKLIVASSMSTYGEGSYVCETCNKVYPEIREINQLEQREWELNCPKCRKKVKSILTSELKPQDCTSIYALTKKDQEKMCLLIGETYGINTTGLRLFNTYGSRQALSNPYTGVCAIFSSRLLAGNRPVIFEDGNQTRDFVHVKDVCQAFILSMEKQNSKYQLYNVGTSIPTTIKKVAEVLAENINPEIKVEIKNKYRPGDIRHCVADISKISSELGYKPQYSFEEGMKELVQWVKTQQGKVKDRSSQAIKELEKKGLLQ